ncbi:unnamed protein product [Didymodactylos carnosus]|uniref:Uncharacterized protein n=1 Tax=Didymodactylos carnosus TaxID=1234261 RepID=A0A8S2I3Q0_9BILA|nr:unnamed protein product [Didymodactylos carnosus]CAF3709835.1 unnamed protein product [Didymodactylos carnosus]
MSRIDLQPPPYADTILLIKHFPSIFNDSDRCEFVQHFGAKRIRSFHDNTTSILNERLKNLIIADFGTSVQARQALYRLHQLEILNKRLVVEYARLDLVQEAFAQQDQEKLKKLLAKLSGRKDDENELFEQQLHGLSAPNDVMYPIRSNLKYRYPQINDQILQNISNALLAVPPFYTQVIHLMNKMSLPCPFGGKVFIEQNRCPTPRRPGETVSQACQADYTELQKEFLTNSENQTNVDMETDTDESELGDDQDLETNLKHNRLQRKANLNIQKQRLKSYRQSNIINKEKSNQIHLENVFDDLSNIKQQTTPIDIKLPTNVELTTITKYVIVRSGIRCCV